MHGRRVLNIKIIRKVATILMHASGLCYSALILCLELVQTTFIRLARYMNNTSSLELFIIVTENRLQFKSKSNDFDLRTSSAALSV